MIRARCDRCGREADVLDGMAGLPDGWFALSLEYRGRTELMFLCSSACVVPLLRALASTLEDDGTTELPAAPTPPKASN